MAADPPRTTDQENYPMRKLILTLALGLMAVHAFAQSKGVDDNPYVRVRALAWTAPAGSGHTGAYAVTWGEALDDQTGIWNPATPKKITVPAGFTKARMHVLWQRNRFDLAGRGLLYPTINNLPGAFGGAKSVGGDEIDMCQGYWVQVQAGDAIRLAFDLWDQPALFDTVHLTVEFR
jgi:hypothetical protein